MSGLLIAAPASGSGKTTVTLGLARALADAGVRLISGKAGPDYIDPAFHAAASGKPCFNYDPWRNWAPPAPPSAIAATSTPAASA